MEGDPRFRLPPLHQEPKGKEAKKSDKKLVTRDMRIWKEKGFSFNQYKKERASKP